MSEVRTVPIEALATDDRFQVRLGGLRESHVRSLVEALRSGAVLPPLLVTPHPDGRRYTVIDGAHRLEAFRRVGLQTVQVVVRDSADFWDAFVANQKHGLPLTVEDRKQAALWLREQRPELSVRQIAQMVGLAPSTVQDVLSGRRRRPTGELIQRPDPWRRFLQAVTKLYTRRGHQEDFTQLLAEAIVDLVEQQPYAGVVWDALSALADAIYLAWNLTEDQYAEQDEKAARS
jgi:ParB/RepB/Spo0J family partition protein